MPTEATILSPIKTLSIEYWPIAKLKYYAKNPRKNDQAVERMCASIREFGFAVPILARSSGEVVDGHLRLKASKKLGLVEVPVILCDGWSEAQVKAFRLMVNRSVAWADWDAGLLGGELIELKGLGFDLGLTGFDVGEIGRLTLQADPAEDEAPPVPEVPVTKLGDLWRLGEHRVLCGDSTDAGCVGRLLGERKPFLMVTDPPYGVNYDPAWRSSLDQWNRATSAFTDKQCLWPLALEQFPGDVIYLWHAGSKAGETAAELYTLGFEVRMQIIWRKPAFVISRGHYHSQHEPCWYAVRKAHSARWSGDRTQSTVWDVANRTFQGGKAEPEDERSGHGTQKPVELMRRPILNHTEPCEAVYDPFLGSGTTVIAAESTERICYGLEIDPGYCDVICSRYRKLTGKEVILDGDGRNFDQVSAARASLQSK